MVFKALILWQVFDHGKISLLGFDFADTSTATKFLSVKTHADKSTNKIHGESHKTDVSCILYDHNHETENDKPSPLY